MTPKNQKDPTKVLAQPRSRKEIEEALSTLDSETKRRIENVQQQMEFYCASLRAKGNAEIKKMLQSIRELTIEDYCQKYNNDKEFFSKQYETIPDTDKNVNKRSLSNETEQPGTETKRQRKSRPDDKVQGLHKMKTNEIEPLFVHMKRERDTLFSIRLDPDYNKESEGYTLDIPSETVSRLNNLQCIRIREQIQALQDQLEDLKHNFTTDIK